MNTLVYTHPLGIIQITYISLHGKWSSDTIDSKQTQKAQYQFLQIENNCWSFRIQSFHRLLQFTMHNTLHCNIHWKSNQYIHHWIWYSNVLYYFSIVKYWKLILLTWIAGYYKSNENDPSAGSPTETLLRLLLPLSNKVHNIYQHIVSNRHVHQS